ncbi:DUF420 domain-containing protein [Planctomicrobium piriforme]|uniref:Protein SCO1/2/putative membrane protein n=1 Tax=Planctomicrobium piriforme TaxID=1576369 RepID=A0A1I3CYZ2_9PLAN|nr:DUF420 domain-containing protein [Planctomicrobium piriforme]SFH79724.1 protein SCO1/2/putative membrane protein [Planctomicrobium piriforme]
MTFATHRFLFVRCAALACGWLLLAGLVRGEEPAAAIVLEPGDNPPPFVQLAPNEAPVVWDAQRVGEFKLVDQLDQPVTRESLLGQPWVANFVFARCSFQCPATCRKIMDLNNEVADVPVRFVTITVDPAHDTVPIMREFADIWKAKPDRWLFCTGEPKQVWDLIRKGFKVAAWENAGTARMPGMEFAHSNHLIHVSKDGEILGRYDSAVDSELVTLKRVLKGQITTPLKFQPATLDALAQFKARQAEAAIPADPLDKLPGWAKRLPATNAALNSLATLLLLAGFFAIKAGAVGLHKRMMLTAFFVSIIFLVCYLTYHYALHEYAGIRGKPFPGTGTLKTVYYTILISHVILAATVPVLAIITIRNGLRAYPEGLAPQQLAELVAERKTHHRWAKVTFPIWLYVSVTGVIIYWMLYHL